MAEIEGRLQRVETVEEGKQLYADHLVRRYELYAKESHPRKSLLQEFAQSAAMLEWQGPQQYEGFALYTEITHHKWSGMMRGGPTRIIVIDTESSTS